MNFSRRHDRWLRKLPTSPKDEGLVSLLVIRPGAVDSGERKVMQSIELSPDGGIEGDRWIQNQERGPGSQVSLVNCHMIGQLAGKTPVELCGDNLHVDLDISESNLPVGTRLQIGSALLEVSDIPHRPCLSFHDRFGTKAAKRVARGNHIGLRGRGVLCQIICGGTISLEDQIIVLRT